MSVTVTWLPYPGSGGGGGVDGVTPSENGSVTPAGVPGTVAQAIQGVPGGVPIPVTQSHAATATGASSFVIAASNTSQVAFAAGSIVAGGFITNPFNATESLFVDFVNAALAASPGTNGTTTELVPGQSFQIPAGLSNAVNVAATTVGHAFVAVKY